VSADCAVRPWLAGALHYYDPSNESDQEHPVGTNVSSSPVDIAASAFKAYDIRGVVPSPLSPEFARRLGAALALEAHRAGVRQVVVGRDGRPATAA